MARQFGTHESQLPSGSFAFDARPTRESGLACRLKAGAKRKWQEAVGHVENDTQKLSGQTPWLVVGWDGKGELWIIRMPHPKAWQQCTSLGNFPFRVSSSFPLKMCQADVRTSWQAQAPSFGSRFLAGSSTGSV